MKDGVPTASSEEGGDEEEEYYDEGVEPESRHVDFWSGAYPRWFSLVSEYVPTVDGPREAAASRRIRDRGGKYRRRRYRALPEMAPRPHGFFYLRDDGAVRSHCAIPSISSTFTRVRCRSASRHVAVISGESASMREKSASAKRREASQS